MSRAIPISSIRRLSQKMESFIQQFDGKSITLLGSSGFVGSWISELLRFEISRGLRCSVKALSRSGGAYTQFDLGKDSRLFQNMAVDLSKNIPREIEESDYFIIAATSSSPIHGSTNHEQIRKTTSGLLNFLERLASLPLSKTKNLVHLSSGAVYKIHGSANSKYPEDENVSDKSSNSYIKSKLDLEVASLKLLNSQLGWRVSNPRIFALYGPGLALDAHFAIGNFVGSGIQKQNIEIRGNPMTVRSYLHISDLTAAVMGLLCNPIATAINLGSSTPITIRDLAEKIALYFPASEICQRSNHEAPSYYVPETTVAVRHLGPLESVDLSEGIRDWIDWLK